MDPDLKHDIMCLYDVNISIKNNDSIWIFSMDPIEKSWKILDFLHDFLDLNFKKIWKK